jgi:hypothetical protein
LTVRVQYNGIPLLNWRTNGFTMEPVRDPSGLDRLYTKCVLDGVFEVHPFSTGLANGKAPLQPPQRPLDSLAPTIRNLRGLLDLDRKDLQIATWADTVFRIPGLDPNDPAKLKRMPCDPGNGPKVLKLFFTDFDDRSCTGRIIIEFNTNACSNLLLSNRWTVQSETTGEGMTTRTVSGYAVMRADAAAFQGGPNQINSVDDFRQWFFVPVPNQFKRSFVRVWVDQAGVAARYVAVDKETMNPLGADGARVGVTSLGGNCTAGSESMFKDFISRGVADVVGGWGDWLFDHTVGAGGGGAAGAAAPMVGQSGIPTVKANGICTVKAPRGVFKRNMANLATRVLLERFNNGVNAFPVSAYCSQKFGADEDEGHFVSVRMEFQPTMKGLIGSAADMTKFGALMSLSNDIGPLPAGGEFFPYNDHAVGNYNLAGGRPFPNRSDYSCRGSWLGSLMTQTLLTDCQPPPLPPVASVFVKEIGPPAVPAPPDPA